MPAMEGGEVTYERVANKSGIETCRSAHSGEDATQL